MILLTRLRQDQGRSISSTCTFMLKSMTAFGRANVISPIGRFSVEIQSVNRKYLEISTSLPRELFRFDPDIRLWVSSLVSRGQINVKISVTFDEVSPVVITPNLPLIKQIKEGWDKIAQELNINSKFSLEMLKGEVGIFHYQENIQEEDKIRVPLKEAVDKALEQFIRVKVTEGENLRKDIQVRLIYLKECLQKIEQRAPHTVEKYRQKLRERLEEVLPRALENEDRLLREVCVFAEKVDITEETVRFASHMEQFNQLINSEQSSLGKNLDFLVQEMNREVNTIGSKSADLDISRLVIDIKSEIERIREQIQNIE